MFNKDNIHQKLNYCCYRKRDSISVVLLVKCNLNQMFTNYISHLINMENENYFTTDDILHTTNESNTILINLIIEK